MKLLAELFSTDYGLMSAAGLGFIFLMAMFFVFYFLRKMKS